MKKFINVAVSLCLLLSLGGCNSVRNDDEIQIEKLFKISEFSEDVIKNEWLPRLKYLEEQALNPREFPEIRRQFTSSFEKSYGEREKSEGKFSDFGYD